VRRFVEEARAQSRIRHPNIAESFSFGQLDDGRCYYAMEWLDGETLSARLRRGPLALAEMVAVLDGVADALEAIHAGSLVHRDLTPGNLFLLRGPHGRVQVKVVDFGVAKQLDAGDLRLTASGMTLGTPTYAAPEQLAGTRGDGRADIYSLGVIGYQMATGELPLDAIALAIGRTPSGDTRPAAAPARDAAARPAPTARAEAAPPTPATAAPPAPRADAAPPTPATAAPPAPRAPATRRRPTRRPRPRAPATFVPPDDPDYLLEPKKSTRP